MVVLCFSVGVREGLSEMSNWLEQPEEGGVDSNDQTKGKEAEEEEQGELLASIEAESSCLETELMETITGNGLSAEDRFQV